MAQTRENLDIIWILILKWSLFRIQIDKEHSLTNFYWFWSLIYMKNDLFYVSSLVLKHYLREYEHWILLITLRWKNVSFYCSNLIYIAVKKKRKQIQILCFGLNENTASLITTCLWHFTLFNVSNTSFSFIDSYLEARCTFLFKH